MKLIKTRTISPLLIYVLIFSSLHPIVVWGKDTLPISSQLLTDSAGQTSQEAMSSVFRISCPEPPSSGTGFLYRTGNVITAAHVVEKCKPEHITILLSNGKKISVSKIRLDSDIDVALLTPSTKIDGEAIPFNSIGDFKVGTQVVTWGFPEGYRSLKPLLSVGYLSGIDYEKTHEEKMIKRYVVNAAFNSGNSGGPLIDVQSSTIIGVVVSKLAPMPDNIESALQAMKKTKSGLQYSATFKDGTRKSLSEAQVIEEVLQFLRSQTQLVVGYAVTSEDLRSFLAENVSSKE